MLGKLSVSDVNVFGFVIVKAIPVQFWVMMPEFTN